MVATPEIRVEKVQPGDLGVILACDGIFDVLSNQQVVDVALEHYGDAKAAASAIVRKAHAKGSEDNLTATVVEFAWEALDEAHRPTAEEEAPEDGPDESGLDIFG